MYNMYNNTQTNPLLLPPPPFLGRRLGQAIQGHHQSQLGLDRKL